MASRQQSSEELNPSFMSKDISVLSRQITELKDTLSLMQAETDSDVESGRPSLVHSARTGTEEVLGIMIRELAARRKFLPTELFADPAWDMLLDLYLADILSKRISVSSLCGASNVPATTALRWIGALGREGLIKRTADPYDARRYFIALSEAGLERMDGYFDSLAQQASMRAH
jgi:DNA-binding MarR family transcriptional regulator